MEKHSLQYLATILKDDVLRFGEFTTKSGRQSPYFFNTGNICSAHSLTIVGDSYAQLVQQKLTDSVDNFYGPAYKGIPLAVIAATRFAQLTGKNVTYTFNRKENKDHGEGGNLVGASYEEEQSVVVVEDVLTAGTSLRESLMLLKNYPVKVAGIVVGIDRQEKGPSGASAANEISETFGVPIFPLVKLDDIISALWNKEVLGKVWIDDAAKDRIDTYRAAYCAND